MQRASKPSRKVPAGAERGPVRPDKAPPRLDPESEEAFLATYDIAQFERPSVAVDIVVHREEVPEVGFGKSNVVFRRNEIKPVAAHLNLRPQHVRSHGRSDLDHRLGLLQPAFAERERFLCHQKLWYQRGS